MEERQKIAIVLAPTVAVSMFLVFQSFALFFGRDTAWYMGFLVYWPVFCLAFPLFLLGKQRLRSLYSFRKLSLVNVLILLVPIFIALIGVIFKSFFNFRSTTTGNPTEIIILIAMSFGNGFFEETLWRGVYSTLFPNKRLWSLFWPSVCFSLWHLAPGSLAHNISPVPLAAGALVFGLCWGFLAYRTNSIVGTSISHTLTGLLSVLMR